MSERKGHPFSQYGNEDTLKNPALYAAFEDFIPFVESVEFSDINNENNRDGVTIDYVMEHFNSKITPKHNSSNQTEESLTYLYESEEVIPKSTQGNHYTATIYFHFLHRRLYYAEIRMQIDAYAAQNFITEDKLSAFVKNKASIETLENESPQTFGMAQIKDETNRVYQLFIPSTDAENNEKAGFLIIENNQIESFSNIPLQEEFYSNHNTMMRNMLNYESDKRKRKSVETIEGKGQVVESELDKLVSIDTLENPASYMAYIALKMVADQLEVGELKGKGEATGSSSKEVADLLHEFSIPTEIKASDHENYLIFVFESAQKNPSTNQNRKAELKAYFYDDHLVYIDIYTLDTQFYQNDITAYALNKSELKKGKKLDDFEKVEPMIIAAGHFVKNGKPQYVAMSPQLQANNELIAVNYLFKTDTLQKAFAKPFSEAQEELRNALISIYFETQKNN